MPELMFLSSFLKYFLKSTVTLHLALCLFLKMFIFGCAGYSLLCGVFSCCNDLLFPGVCGFSLRWFSCCRAQAQQQWRMGLAALLQVGSSQSRVRSVPCIGRRILHHWVTREALKIFFSMWTIFKVFLEFVIILCLFLCFCFLAQRHVGSQLPNLRSNQHPLYWKRKFFNHCQRSP